VDTLKIDQSFVKRIPDDSSDSAIVRAIIALAQSLQLNLVAEGVETQQQLSFMRQHGCNLVQGYLFSPPVQASEFEHHLGKQVVRGVN
jgi:EAL domain-containing protein (putative c-di-GMP-specific phosphodiesterase class I)